MDHSCFAHDLIYDRFPPFRRKLAMARAPGFIKRAPRIDLRSNAMEVHQQASELKKQVQMG